MPSQRFKKDFLQNIIHYNGQVLRFETVGPSTGVLRTEDDALIAFLNDLADHKRKGIRRLSAEQYEAIKKNTKRAKSSAPSLPQVRVFDHEKLLPKGLKDSSPAVQPVARPPAPVFTQPATAAPPKPPALPPPTPPAPTPVVATPPVKPRTMKKSQLKEKEAKSE